MVNALDSLELMALERQQVLSVYFFTYQALLILFFHYIPLRATSNESKNYLGC